VKKQPLRAIFELMKVKNYSTCFLTVLAALILISCSAFPSGRREEATGKQELRMYWILEGTPGSGSSEIFLTRYHLPTSLTKLMWTEFVVRGKNVEFTTQGGYRIVTKKQVLTEPLGNYTVYGYDLNIEVTVSPPSPPGPPESFSVSFSYAQAARTGSGVLAQPLEQAMIAGIRKSGLRSGRALVENLKYLGSGKFKARVLVSD